MGKRVVCAGTFDHLHLGHIDFLRQARTLGDELIVIIARDETVQRIKGFLPTDNEQKRMRNVKNSGIPAKAVLGNLKGNMFDILESLKPDIIALGYDQRVSEEELIRRFPHCRIQRLAPFEPEKYKSTYYRNQRQ